MSFIKSNGFFLKVKDKGEEDAAKQSRILETCAEHFLRHMLDTLRQAGLSKATLSGFCGSQIIWCT